MNGPFVRHCGHCGMPLHHGCACASDADHTAALADVGAVLALISVPPPVVPHTKARTYHKWGDYMICDRCKMAQQWCGCDKQTPPPPQGDGDDSSLNRRIKDWKGTP